MTRKTWSAISWRGAVLGFVVGACAVAAAGHIVLAAPQEPPPAREGDVLPALLSEVRGLRVAIEQMASAGPRIQLSVARLQLEESRLNTLIRRLDNVRDSLQAARQDVAEMQAQAARAEKHLNDDPMGPDHEQLAEVLANGKRQLVQRQSEIARLTNDESELQQQIAEAQSRWTVINQRLDELDRALEKK